MKQLSLSFLVLAVLAVTPALAQEDDGNVVLTEKPTISVISDCDRPEGLCLKSRVVDKLSLPSRRPALSRFNKLTRMAGMLMGTVEAAQVGAFRVKVVLDLR